jgi:flagellar motor switch protein FliN/FliY
VVNTVSKVMDDTLEDKTTFAESDSAETSAVGVQQAQESAAETNGALNLGSILSIPVTVQVILGSTLMPVSALMKLGRGGVISLDQRVGDPVSIIVNGRIVGRGEIVVVDEDSARFGVSLTEIVTSAGDGRGS